MAWIGRLAGRYRRSVAFAYETQLIRADVVVVVVASGDLKAPQQLIVPSKPQRSCPSSEKLQQYHRGRLLSP
jgi:hypothetical protein